jgi:hypothetical protein
MLSGARPLKGTGLREASPKPVQTQSRKMDYVREEIRYRWVRGQPAALRSMVKQV